MGPEFQIQAQPAPLIWVQTGPPAVQVMGDEQGNVVIDENNNAIQTEGAN